MNDRKQAGRIIFQTTKHHKQILRSQIDSRLIDAIEIDPNPSLNYMNAYKNLYHDELQRTVSLHQQKKLKQQILNNQDKNLYVMGIKEERPPMIDTTNMSSSQLSKYGQRYVDYDEEKTLKKEQHVKKNYDGGQAFYKAHDQHLQRKQQEAQVTNQLLSTQIQYHEYMRHMQQEKKNQENRAFQEHKYYQWLQEKEKMKQDKSNQTVFRQDMVQQIQQERERRQRKSEFKYQSIARHNPITNPIEYHIDNPYILKDIQKRKNSTTIGQRQYENARY